MNVEKYKSVIKKVKENGMRCIDKEKRKDKKNEWKPYISAKLSGITDTIVYDEDIDFDGKEELMSEIRKAETEIWDYVI